MFLQTQANLSRRQVRWSEYLQAFKFRWQYRPGRIDVANPLSRVQVVTVAAVTRGKRKCAVPELSAANPSADPSSVPPSDPGTVLPQNPNLTTKQQSLTDFQLQVQQGHEQDTDWLDGLSPADQAKCCEKQGFWWYGDALVIPDSQNLRKQCLHELHNCQYSGHLGITKTLKAMERLYWWKGMRKDVRQHIRNCSECQKNKTNNNQKPGGLLQPLQIPGRRWESISVDLITQLPMTRFGNTKIVVFVDRLSKMVFLVLMTWQDCICAPSSEHMECNVRLSMTGTPSLPVHSGKSLQRLLVPRLPDPLLIIQPRMDRQKEQTEHWKKCLGILSVQLRLIGTSTLTLLNLPSITPGRNHYRILLSCRIQVNIY